MGNEKIVEKPLEELVKLLLPTQIDINFHIECLKAQTLVIRSNLIRNTFEQKGKDKEQQYYKHLDFENMREIWKEKFDENVEKINRAVRETEGLIITFKGNPIRAYYHENCGGSTENSEDVLGCCITYLRKVLCDYCKESPNFLGMKKYSVKDLERVLEAKNFKENKYSEEISGFIDNIVRDDEGRVIKITIWGIEYTGREIMKLLNLDSTRFYISPLNLQITSIGKGHGLGFCQNGGNEMANRGFSFDELIKYYYTGVEIEKYTFPSIKEPLFGNILILDPGHGGIDCGCVGKLGLKESEVVLKLSQKLKDKLESFGAKVYLTRDRDREVLLRERIEMTNRIRPNFLISFHMNYFPNSTMKGCEVHYYRGDLESKYLGNIILKNLEEEMNIVNRGVKEGKFSLLKGVGVNSLILEIGFLSNEEEERQISQKEYLKNMAEVITKSILEYYEN